MACAQMPSAYESTDTLQADGLPAWGKWWENSPELHQAIEAIV